MFQSIVEAVFDHAQNTPNKLCLADDNAAVTYREYEQKILKFASFFAQNGLKSGDKVVVEANQSIDYLAIQLSLQLLGIIFVPVEHNCAADKISAFIERAGAAAVISNSGEFSECKSFSHSFISSEIETIQPYTATRLPKADDICEILFSTGTTGKEKGIVMIHKNNIALAQNVMHGVEMQPDNVEMIPSPLNHSHGLRRYYANMYNGSSVVILGSVMDMSRFFGNIERYNVNSMDLVPSALAVVLRLSKGKLAEYSDKLRYIQFGSAPLMADDVKKVCELLPDTRMYNIYGSTESGCTCIYSFNRRDAKDHCIGRPTCNTKVIIVDDDRAQINSSAEHTGLIATAGEMNMLCYYNDDKETARAMENGVIYSNDVGYIDDDGEIILIGRKGDVINIGGNKVSPEEIENAAKKMDDVIDCGCIGVADQTKGQVPKLFVQTSSKDSFDSKRIRAFLMEHLEPYKVPVYIEYIEKIPRTFNGKIIRKELR